MNAFKNLSIDPGILNSLWCIPLPYFQWMELKYKSNPGRIELYKSHGIPERILNEVRKREKEFNDIEYLFKMINSN